MTGARILVIDDEPALRAAVERNLAGHGFDVRGAESAETGLELETRFHPDLVLLDMVLPEDGRDRSFDSLEIFERCVVLAARRLGVPYGTYRRHLALAKERLIEQLLRQTATGSGPY